MKCVDCGEEKTKNEYLRCKKCGYKNKTRKSGLTYIKHKENPTSFKKGHVSWLKGTKGLIKGSKKLLGVHSSENTEFKKGHTPWNCGIEYMADEKHPNWKGDDVGYLALHTWIYRKLGNAQLCSSCGATTSKRFVWHNKNLKYKRNLEDWERLCSKCHGLAHRLINKNKK